MGLSNVYTVISTSCYIKETTLVNYSAIYLRDELLKRTLENSVHKLLLCDDPNKLVSLPTPLNQRHMVLNSDYFCYCYHKTYIIGQALAKKNVKPRLNPAKSDLMDEAYAYSLLPHEQDLQIYSFEAIMQNDLNSVNYFFALIAWLTIDEFRWHLLPDFKHIKEDLSYGLVLEYPDVIGTLAKFILGFSRHEMFDKLSQEDLMKIDEIALQDATRN